MNYATLLPDATQQIAKGAFLTAGPVPNVMTIGWAQWGFVWGKPICAIFVRKSRYTHGLLEKDGRFTISVPRPGTFAAELAHCGKVSARTENKLETQGLSLLPSKADGIPGILGCGQYFECKVVFQAESDLTYMEQSILNRFYADNQATPDGDPHTIYFGEILEAYEG